MAFFPSAVVSGATGGASEGETAWFVSPEDVIVMTSVTVLGSSLVVTGPWFSAWLAGLGDSGTLPVVEASSILQSCGEMDFFSVDLASEMVLTGGVTLMSSLVLSLAFGVAFCFFDAALLFEGALRFGAGVRLVLGGAFSAFSPDRPAALERFAFGFSVW